MEGTVLVADDDRTIRTVLAQALTRAGCRVRATGTTSTLWRWIEEGEGDVVVTDVMMPDGDALDLLPAIRKRRPDLPVIVMSAQGNPPNCLGCAHRGVETNSSSWLRSQSPSARHEIASASSWPRSIEGHRRPRKSERLRALTALGQFHLCAQTDYPTVLGRDPLGRLGGSQLLTQDGHGLGADSLREGSPPRRRALHSAAPPPVAATPLQSALPFRFHYQLRLSAGNLAAEQGGFLLSLLGSAHQVR